MICFLFALGIIEIIAIAGRENIRQHTMKKRDFSHTACHINRHGYLQNSMLDMYDLLQEITEEDISLEYWDESDYK